jgi:hypothetical protein
MLSGRLCSGEWANARRLEAEQKLYTSLRGRYDNRD